MNDQNLDSENLSEIPPQIPVEVTQPKNINAAITLLIKVFSIVLSFTLLYHLLLA